MSEISDLDEVDANNTSLSGIPVTNATLIAQLDDLVRAELGMLARWAGDDTLVATATTNLGSVPGQYIVITGSTGITAGGTIKAGTIKHLKFTGAPLLTHNATSFILPGGANIQAAAGDSGVFVSEGSGNWRCIDYQRADGTALVVSGSSYSPGTIYGLTLANNATDAVNDIDIAIGAARSASDTANIDLLSALTKQLDVAWAVGTNAGMRATGVAIANTTYHIFAIKRPDTGVVDIAADTDVTGANIPANTNAAYTLRRRIGSIIRAGATILAFTQVGDEFLLTTPSLDVNAANPGTAAVTRTLNVPIGLRLTSMAIYVLANAGTGVNSLLYVSALDQTDAAVSGSAAPLAQITNVVNSAGGVANGAAQISMRTNTSGQVRTRLNASDASVTLRVSTYGWLDARGRS